ncbi:hypothetical protein SS1G_08316 [Sclerotinia sclerotiorum 1980 UF-70]|uniref:N-acetyltransferase domain-containing protein n=2 Tax=Sclerotinia sclerotiorum (strain ATCC 18683 / 1980 / Ss-1) TaxID=665079 RepID=A7ESL1_SCLS1|nr:hypothetical protein SS1G_08316 [Sclerotinia sclerotiorum 1980 UF-70]APA12853.1 hypothetical protein sscle_10g076230 [Sclerotinia sclerotiorum 1980 UF-70]EDN92453.1 hypothetical protein SS1G_08316 [Sclerotinia sclerotiorum 1980 UF-70]
MANVINNNNSTLILEKKRSLSPATTEEVRVVGISEYEGAAQCLAEAFATDEVARYFIDTDDMSSYSEKYKWKLHCDILKYMTAAHCYKGIVTTIGPNYDAVALWMPPGQDMDDWLTFFRSGLWKLYFKLSAEGRKRFYDEFMPLLHHTIDHVMGERNNNFYYLVYLGSKPSARGKGYAKKLIQHMTDRADRENRPTYLESSAEINLSYYRKLGFEWKTDILMERGSKPVKMQIMVREPRFVGESSNGKEDVEIRMIE